MKSLATLQAPDFSVYPIAGGGGNQLLKWIVDKFYPVGSYFIVGSATNPNTEFKGDGWSTEWKELPQGTFLRATGTNGAISSGTAIDGGSNTHYHEIKVRYIAYYDCIAGQDEKIIRLYDYNTGGFRVTEGVQGVTTENVNAGLQTDFFANNTMKSFDNTGTTSIVDNQPPYKNCHIWLRTK